MRTHFNRVCIVCTKHLTINRFSAQRFFVLIVLDIRPPLATIAIVTNSDNDNNIDTTHSLLAEGRSYPVHIKSSLGFTALFRNY